MKHKNITKEFTVENGIEKSFYKKVCESEGCYVYEVKTNIETHYELFEIKKHLNAETLELNEIYPNEEDFGNWAWRFKEFPTAMGCISVLKSLKELKNNFEEQKHSYFALKSVHLQTLSRG
jgi:hypothetical protein